MKISGEEAKTLAAELREVCDLFKRTPDELLSAMLGGTIEEASRTLKGIEMRIAEVGGLSGDVIGAIMVVGAMCAVLEDLPAGDERREIIAAGREVGKLIAQKFGEKITDDLKMRETVH